MGWKGPQWSSSFNPPAMCGVTNQQTRLPRATSNLALNASRDGASTASLGNLFQCSPSSFSGQGALSTPQNWGPIIVFKTQSALAIYVDFSKEGHLGNYITCGRSILLGCCGCGSSITPWSHLAPLSTEKSPVVAWASGTAGNFCWGGDAMRQINSKSVNLTNCQMLLREQVWTMRSVSKSASAAAAVPWCGLLVCHWAFPGELLTGTLPSENGHSK